MQCKCSPTGYFAKMKKKTLVRRHNFPLLRSRNNIPPLFEEGYP
jgi:hypothetical protein